MVFRKNEQCKRANHAAKNFAIVGKVGLKLLKKYTEKNHYTLNQMK
jgi:hypothetical protein